MTTSPKHRIIFPLDFQTLSEALKYAKLLKDHVGVFKIGLELFTSSGPESIKAVKDATGLKVFLDLKLHDIPETVKRATKAAIALGVDFLTVHAEGIKGLKGFFVDAKAGNIKILGVTTLTSLSEADLKESGIEKTPDELVIIRARISKEAGLSGVVCSGQEVQTIKKAFGPDFLAICPGIRSEEDKRDDQKRTSTAYEAIYNGADYIVVGRPIKNSPDPQRAASFIALQIENACKLRP